MVQFILSENYLSEGLYLHFQGKSLIHHMNGLFFQGTLGFRLQGSPSQCIRTGLKWSWKTPDSKGRGRRSCQTPKFDGGDMFTPTDVKRSHYWESTTLCLPE